MKQINIKLDDELYYSFCEKCSNIGKTPVQIIRELIFADIKKDINFNSQFKELKIYIEQIEKDLNNKILQTQIEFYKAIEPKQYEVDNTLDYLSGKDSNETIEEILKDIL